MERQTRNISLLTLFIAALGSVAIISAEHQRSTVNTLILIVAVAAAVGSLAALVGLSGWFGVLRGDVRDWWRERPSRRWKAAHYPAKEPAPNTFDFDLGPNEKRIREQGMPCWITGLLPRTLGVAETRPMRNVTVEASMKRREGRPPETVDLAPLADDSWGAMARWPDRWFDAEQNAPIAGRYLVSWELRHPNGRIERRAEPVHFGPGGIVIESRVTRMRARVRAFFLHYRSKDV
ncbi:MAG TPA: hypothetical protein VMI13_06480 [Solirubrobacteraceae bacterium]|nr:hypothetical protein [Solirubrobacteraceae bacterium]